MINPLDYLIDIIPASKRKIVYAVLSVGLFVYGLIKASNGDWAEVIVPFVSSLVSAMATANTGVTADPE